MVTVHFTSHLEAFAECEPVGVDAQNVWEALHEALADKAKLRGYVLDEHGRLRRHMVVFVDGKIINDRIGLSDPVNEDSEVYVMQALSGG